MLLKRAKMLNFKKTKNKVIKATIESLVVAFLYSILFLSITNILFKSEIKNLQSKLDLISVNTIKENLKDTKLDEKQNLTNYPEYGTRYASIKIPSLDIDLPVYYGDTLSILKKGVGHSSGSYFPGEGGSILYMGHNTSNMLKKLKDIEENATIIIETSYGTYYYNVYQTKIINYKETDEVETEREEEILMLYTCYESLRFGHTEKRFVAYAKLENKEKKVVGNENNN